MEKTATNPSGYDWAQHAWLRTSDLRVHDGEISEAQGACVWLLRELVKAEAAGDSDLAQLHRLQYERRSAFLMGLEAERLVLAEIRDFCASVAARLAV